MRPGAYERRRELSDKHWWWIGRRNIMSTLLNGLKISENAKVFEIGCGTGSNLPLWTRYGMVYATDTNEQMVSVASERNVATVERGSLPYIHNISRDRIVDRKAISAPQITFSCNKQFQI